MELKMIELKRIVANPLQPRQDFDREKLQELADSIREAELLQSIVVRKNNGGDFEIVAGERRFKAFQILKEPKIPAIVRNIKDDTDALEKSSIENWQRVNLSDRENDVAIKTLLKSGRYKNPAELSRKTGASESFISQHIEVNSFREKEKIPESVSYTTIRATQGLTTEVRKKAIEIATQKDIPARKLMDEIVPKIKKFPEPEQQMEILEEFEEQEEQSKEIFNNIIQKKKEIAEGEREPEHIVEIEPDPDKRMLEDYQNIKQHVFGIYADHIQHFKSEELKQEAIRTIQDIINYLNKQLVELGVIQEVNPDET